MGAPELWGWMENHVPKSGHGHPAVEAGSEAHVPEAGHGVPGFGGGMNSGGLRRWILF